MAPRTVSRHELKQVAAELESNLAVMETQPADYMPGWRVNGFVWRNILRSALAGEPLSTEEIAAARESLDIAVARPNDCFAHRRQYYYDVLDRLESEQAQRAYLDHLYELTRRALTLSSSKRKRRSSRFLP